MKTEHQISNLENISSYLEEYFKSNIKSAVTLDHYPRHREDEFPFYTDVRKHLYEYFGAQKLINFMRCYEALEEIETLMSGLGEDLYGYCKAETQLTQDDVTFFERKKDRIISVIRILKQKEVRSISDLPNDYKGMISATQI